MSMPETEILFVSHKYPPSIGGMEKQSYELIAGVARYSRVHRIVYTGEESIITFFVLLNRRISRYVKDNPNIRIIHFNDGLIASMALFHRGYGHIKRTVTVHGLDVVFPLPYFQRKIFPRFNRFDKIIAVSKATAEAAIQRGIHEQRITVIPNGVDHQIAGKKQAELDSIRHKYPRLDIQKRYFIPLGRPVKRKGFSWLIDKVIPHVKGDFQLVMIGPFQQQATWTEKVLNLLPGTLHTWITLFSGYPTDQSNIRKLLKKHPNILHLGAVPNEDLKILLANATAFLMPNIPVAGDMEGFGLVCLEASLAQVPVVASSLDGITSAIQHEHNGILLPPLDEQAWCKQLQDILENPIRYREKSIRFRTFTLANYGWEKMAQAYRQLFLDVVSGQRTTPW